MRLLQLAGDAASSRQQGWNAEVRTVLEILAWIRCRRCNALGHTMQPTQKRPVTNSAWLHLLRVAELAVDSGYLPAPATKTLSCTTGRSGFVGVFDQCAKGALSRFWRLQRSRFLRLHCVMKLNLPSCTPLLCGAQRSLRWQEAQEQ